MREVRSAFRKSHFLCIKRLELFPKPMKNSRTISNKVITLIKIKKMLIVWSQLHRHEKIFCQVFTFDNKNEKLKKKSP